MNAEDARDATPGRRVARTTSDWMREALALARDAQARGEVPVGAIVVRDGTIVGRGGNAPIDAQRSDRARRDRRPARTPPLRSATIAFPTCELYVTLEPCAMCAGAIMHARVRRLVFGARDPKTGACGSVDRSLRRRSAQSPHPRDRRGARGRVRRAAVGLFRRTPRRNLNGGCGSPFVSIGSGWS